MKRKGGLGIGRGWRKGSKKKDIDRSGKERKGK